MDLTILRIFLFSNLLYLSLQFQITSSSTHSLRMVQILFRHGDRHPIWKYPTDPHFNSSLFSPAHLGELTNRGKKEQYALGRYLRSRYDGFLDSNYIPHQVLVLSSDMDRTIMSAQMNLAGLYEPKNLSSNWDSSVNWSPVPVRTVSEHDDNFLGMHKVCPRRKEVLKSIRNSEIMKKTREKHREFLEFLAEQTGYSTKEDFSINDAAMIRDILIVERLHNYTLPAWAREEGVLERLAELSGLDFKFMTLTDEAKRLNGGPLLERILRAMEGNGKTKLIMYSAHDSTLARLMGTLGLFNLLPLPYASALIIELHQDPVSKAGYVKILFRNETRHEPYSLDVPTCAHPCSLKKLIEVTEHLIASNWEEECWNQSLISHIPYITPLYLSLCTLMASLVVLSIMVARQEKGKGRKHRRSRSSYETI